MAKVIRALAICLAVCFSAPLRAEEAVPAVDPVRIAAARDLLEVTGVTKNMDGMIKAMSRGKAIGATSEAGKELSGEFDASMKKVLEYKDQIISDVAVVYAQTFTAEEMKAVADFYRSGPGAKFVALAPELMQKNAAIGMKYSEKIAKEMQPATPATTK